MAQASEPATEAGSAAQGAEAQAPRDGAAVGGAKSCHLARTHACASKPTHAQTPGHTDTHARAHTGWLLPRRTHPHEHAHARTRTHTQMQRSSSALAVTKKCATSESRMQNCCRQPTAHTAPRAHSDVLSHAFSHVFSHAWAHAHARTLTGANAHARTHAPSGTSSACGAARLGALAIQKTGCTRGGTCAGWYCVVLTPPGFGAQLNEMLRHELENLKAYVARQACRPCREGYRARMRCGAPSWLRRSCLALCAASALWRVASRCGAMSSRMPLPLPSCDAALRLHGVAASPPRGRHAPLAGDAHACARLAQRAQAAVGGRDPRAPALTHRHGAPMCACVRVCVCVRVRV